MLVAVFLLGACAPQPAATQDPALVEQVTEQAVALTAAAEDAQKKDQQLIEQAVALTVAALNSQATERAMIATVTPTSIAQDAESVPLPGGSTPAAVTTITFDPKVPSVDSVQPPEGSTQGGTVVTIAGENFIPSTASEDLGVTQFWFGNNQATDVECQSDIECTAKTPPGMEGIVLVEAENIMNDENRYKSQHTEGNAEDGFKYNAIKYGCDVFTVSPDNMTNFEGGDGFVIKWIVKNSGLSPWPIGLDFKFAGGVNMSSTTRIELPAMNPNDTLQVKLDAVAPNNPGTYYMTWIVEGMGCNGYIAIVVE
jgi:hypothetical protein